MTVTVHDYYPISILACLIIWCDRNRMLPAPAMCLDYVCICVNVCTHCRHSSSRSMCKDVRMCVSLKHRNSLWPNTPATLASLLHGWGADGCLWSAISILTCKVNTLFLSHPICEQGLMLKMSGLIFHHMSNEVLPQCGNMPKKRTRGQKHAMFWSQTLRTDIYKSQIRCNTSFYSKH